MANEFGYWAGGAAGSAQIFFVAGGGANVASNLYTAPSGATITHVRAYRSSGGAATVNFKIALYVTSGGVIPASATPVQSVTINNVNDPSEFGADVSWALTNGVVYALAVEPLDNAANISCSTLSNGCLVASAVFTTGWSTATTFNVQLELAADVTISGSGAGRLVGGNLVNGSLLGSLVK